MSNLTNFADRRTLSKMLEDVNADLAAKADLAGAVFTGAISAPNLSGTNTGDQFTAMASSRVLGRVTAGPGAAEELTSAQILTLLGGTTGTGAIARAGNPTFTGTVTAGTFETGTTGFKSSDGVGGLEMTWLGTQSRVFSFDRVTLTYQPLQVSASAIVFNISGSDVATASSTGLAVTGVVAATGNVTGANLSGTNTGDQFTSIATASILGRQTAGTGAAEVLTITQALTVLGGGSAPTGTGIIVRAASPTLTGTVTFGSTCSLSNSGIDIGTGLRIVTPSLRVEAANPIVTLTDTDTTTPSHTGYINWKDNAATTTAELGFRSSGGNFEIDNKVGQVRIRENGATVATLTNTGSPAGLVVTGVVTASTWLKSGSYTVATMPAAGTAGVGARIYVSNEIGGAVLAFSDNTNWRRVTDRAVVA